MLRKKNKTAVVRAVCRNCGTPLVGRYCHVCGQDVFAGTNHRLREFFTNSFNVIFAWDSKIFRTLWALTAFPGRLTKEYLDGRITRYVHPSKLFWFMTIVFFALLLSQIKVDDAEKDGFNEAITEILDEQNNPVDEADAEKSETDTVDANAESEAPSVGVNIGNYFIDNVETFNKKSTLEGFPQLSIVLRSLCGDAVDTAFCRTDLPVFQTQTPVLHRLYGICDALPLVYFPLVFAIYRCE
jgi:hypothetical protein